MRGHASRPGCWHALEYSNAALYTTSAVSEAAVRRIEFFRERWSVQGPAHGKCAQKVLAAITVTVTEVGPWSSEGRFTRLTEFSEFWEVKWRLLRHRTGWWEPDQTLPPIQLFLALMASFCEPHRLPSTPQSPETPPGPCLASELQVALSPWRKFYSGFSEGLWNTQAFLKGFSLNRERSCFTQTLILKLP